MGFWGYLTDADKQGLYAGKQGIDGDKQGIFSLDSRINIILGSSNLSYQRTSSLISPFLKEAFSMSKYLHEMRDPIHTFIRYDSDEKKVLDSKPFQRLRYIHQLALTYLIYPGATHKRFEHSLGVMELSGRVYDVITSQENIHPEIRELFPETTAQDKKAYWRRVLRMAALCHDIGHLPFSHAAEKELLPEGWDHEKITRELIQSEEMQKIWADMTPPLNPDHIVKLAIGPKKAKDLNFSDWEAILAEVITGDAFGVDRMDYLLRDSYYTGVAYGRFDHYRLIDTLRILPPPPSGESEDNSSEPSLGVESGGLQAAESLLIARYLMYTQVYLHPVRRIYDIHLKEFLSCWLARNKFSTDLEDHLSMTDNEVMTAILKASRVSSEPGSEHADRIIKRAHFKELYSVATCDIQINTQATEYIFKAAEDKYGSSEVRFDDYIQKNSIISFPVLRKDHRIEDGLSLSQILKTLPVVAIKSVFIAPHLKRTANLWLQKNRSGIISACKEI